jgi:hypothetical protein
MQFMITIPPAMIARVATFLGKLGILLEEVPAAQVVAPTTSAPSKRKGRSLPVGQRNFKCHAPADTAGCEVKWVGSETEEKARWANSNLLCATCAGAGVRSAANPISVANIVTEVESALADAIAGSTEWGDDGLPG